MSKRYLIQENCMDRVFIENVDGVWQLVIADQCSGVETIFVDPTFSMVERAVENATTLSGWSNFEVLPLKAEEE